MRVLVVKHRFAKPEMPMGLVSSWDLIFQAKTNTRKKASWHRAVASISLQAMLPAYFASALMG